MRARRRLAVRRGLFGGCQPFHQCNSASPASPLLIRRPSPALTHPPCRSMSGALPLPVAQWVIAAAVKGAAAMRPRLALELEEAMGDWMRRCDPLGAGAEAARTQRSRLCTLPLASTIGRRAAHRPACPPCLYPSRSAPERSNNIVKAAPTVLAPTAPSSAAKASASAPDKRQ